MPPLDPAYPFFGGAKLSPPDHRDWQYMGLPFMAAPQNNDLRDLAPPVRFQDATNACTGFGGTAIRMALTNKYHLEHGEPLSMDDLLSPRHLYYHTRKDEDRDFPNDAGATMRSACQAIKDFGVCPERFMPWDDDQLNDAPSEEAEQAARDYGVSGYLRLPGAGQQLLAQVLSCLGDGYPVFIAINVHDSFVQTGADGRVRSKQPGEKVLGGHALAVFGSFADNSYAGGGNLVTQNSWSESWGERGWCYVPWQYVLDGTLVEAWTIR